MREVGVGHFEATPRMRELVAEVLDSGRISYGPMSQRLEREFAAIHGCKFGVLSNSGTSSLQVAIQALKETGGWEDGSEVVVPALTFVATVNVVLHNRLRPVLVDVDPGTYNMDPGLLEDAMTDDTVAVVPVHLFGQPCDMSGVMDVCRDAGVAVVEDSCECMFADWGGKRVGSWGDVGCFSTYVAHILATGVGGVATTNDPDLAVKMRSLVNHGRDGIYISIDDDAPGLPGFYEVVKRRFNFEAVGHSFRITELEAALALAQLEDWEQIVYRRRLNAAFLTRQLADLSVAEGGPLLLPGVSPRATHSWMMYPIMLHWGDKWTLCRFLEERGIETRELLRLTDQPVYRRMGLWDPEDFPVAKAVNRNGFYVGCHPGLDEEDLLYVSEALHNWFGPHQGY